MTALHYALDAQVLRLLLESDVKRNEVCDFNHCTKAFVLCVCILKSFCCCKSAWRQVWVNLREHAGTKKRAVILTKVAFDLI